MIEETYTPWRYRCPGCGSTSFRRRTAKQKPSNSEYKSLPGKHSIGRLKTIVLKYKYKCDNCKAEFNQPKDMLLDPPTKVHAYKRILKNNKNERIKIKEK
jgi:DNA-directed RNA polymerase subunit RPC12/RpoP